MAGLDWVMIGGMCGVISLQMRVLDMVRQFEARMTSVEVELRLRRNDEATRRAVNDAAKNQLL
jgi:hypothetical protein